MRSRARDALTTILRERPGEVLWAVLPMASYLSGRRRGGAALRIVEKLVEDEFDRVAPILLRGGDQRGRRLAYTIGDRLGRWTYSDLLGFALTDPDPLVRSRAAESVRVEAVRRGDVAALRKLAGVRWAAVRSLALVGLADLGHEDELSAYLDDPSPLIRAYARSRTADAAGRYRAAIAVAPTPELLIGLAEMGDRRDVPLLTPLVTHVDGRVRAAAARSLALLDSVPLDEAIPLLTDPVPAVVREVSLVLRGHHRRLPLELPWRLLTDPRPELRLAGHRLLSARGVIPRMAGALVLAADPEPLLARRGRAEALDLIPALRDPRLYLDGLSAPDGALTSDELARLSNLRPPDERALPDALRPPGDLTRPGGSVRLDGLARSDVPAPHGGLAQVDHLGQTGDEGEPGPASPAVAVEPPVRADAGKRTWTVLSALAERARPALGGHCDRLRTALMGLDRPRRPE